VAKEEHEMHAEAVAYGDVDWVEEARGVHARPLEVAGGRWALVDRGRKE
jgi:hypothetical protein